MHQNILILILLVMLPGCGVLPINTALNEDHFRLENFKRDIDDDNIQVYLMCSNAKPTTWSQPKQHLAGQKDFWVAADFSRDNIDHS